MQQDVVAVVPTFRPTASVVERVRVLATQCAVVISDDASPCTSDSVLRTLSEIPDISVIRHRSNAGIARGLNDGLRRAQELGSAWLLTLDQDTTIAHDYVARIRQAADAMQTNHGNIGVVGAERINDRSGLLEYPLTQSRGLHTTEEVIQTGSLWSIDALTLSDGFDTSLGIDAVDAAACLRLRELGFVVAVVRGLELDHNLGEARTIRLLGRTVMLTGHEAARRTTMVRNRLHLFPREFRQSPRHALRTLRRVAVNHSLSLVTETDRIAKAKGSIRGILRQPGSKQ
jgi:GT2 family glycosyltransferase